MGFWSNLRRRKAETRASYTRTDEDLLIGQQFHWLSGAWQGSDSGGGALAIGPHGPFRKGGFPFQPVVTRATSLITGPLTAAPFKVGDSSPLWLSDPALLRPDSRVQAGSPLSLPYRVPRSLFWSEWIRSAAWFGEGFFIAQEDAQGRPAAGTMRVLHPHLITTRRDNDDVLHWVIEGDRDNGWEDLWFSRDGYITLGPHRYRLTVLRNPHSPIDSEGRSMGVFEMCGVSFKIMDQIETYTSGTFRSGIPSGYLKETSPEGLDQQQADELKRRWLENHGGDRRSIAVLNASTEFHSLSFSPVDSALAEVKRMTMADVAMAFGLDPATLSAQPSGGMNYQNLRDAWANHRDFGLAPWIAAVEDTLSSLAPAGRSVIVDLDGFANPTEKERYEAGEVAVRAGLLTADEWREREGLPPLPPVSDPPPAPPDPETDEPDEPAPEEDA